MTFAAHLAEVAVAAGLAQSPNVPPFVCSVCGRSVGARVRNGEQTPEGYIVPGSTGWWEHDERCPRCFMKEHRRKRDAELRARPAAQPVDVPALLKILAALPVFDDTPKTVRRGIKLDIGVTKYRYARGRAFGGARRLRLVYGRSTPPEQVAEVLLHELVHLALPRGTGHNERFRLTLVRAAREAWGIEGIDPSPKDWSKSERKIAYHVDTLLWAALKERLASGAVVLPEPPAKPSRSARAEALVEKRAAHAAKMLATAEKKLKSAQRSAKRWREKVNYYERQAARRGDRE